MERFLTYIVAFFGIVILMIIWVLIQGIWKKTFQENIVDEDALADRSTCGNCGCGTVCRKNN